MNDTFDKAKQAYLCIDGWAGRHDYAVLVIGEQLKAALSRVQ